MSLEDEAAASQETIWDFDIDAVAGLTGAGASVTTIVGHAIENSQGSSPGSVLSSAPSGLLTPTVGSNPGEDGYGAGSERRIYERRRRIRKSWVYFPENGNEYTTIDGKTRWRCARCKLIFASHIINYHSIWSLVLDLRGPDSAILTVSVGPTKGLSVTFADSSTKNMIEHLHEVHKIGKEGPIPLEQGQVLIETAFGKTRPQVTFNTDLFRDLLLRWIIENHISFSQVEKGSFRVLLRYLVACVSVFLFLIRYMQLTWMILVERHLYRDATSTSQLRQYY